MKTNALPTLLKFLALTLPLTWWWMNGGQQAYWEHVYKPYAFPVLGWLGVTTFPPSAVRERLMNFLPFLALMISTPGMTLKVRLKRSSIGLALIFLGQIALGYWAYIAFEGRGPQDEATAAFFPAVVASDALPFVLWALMAREFVGALLASVLPPTPPTKASAKVVSVTPPVSVTIDLAVEAEASPEDDA
jgi:hypothetical protein